MEGGGGDTEEQSEYGRVFHERKGTGWEAQGGAWARVRMALWQKQTAKRDGNGTRERPIEPRFIDTSEIRGKANTKSCSGT